MAARRSNRAAIFLLVAVIAVVSVVAGYFWWQSGRVPSGPLTLTETTFGNLDGWSTNDPRPALAAFARSCARLLALPPAQKLTGTGYAGGVGDWAPACRNLPPAAGADDARHFFETNFVPVEVGQGASRDGLFTGYYEPQLRGSRIVHGQYRTPVYGEPDDLVQVDLGDFRDSLKGERIAGRLEGDKLVPYATRADIDRNGLRQAAVLFYADDPAAVFFLHIQGFGRVVLDNGRVERVAYAAQNGRPYTPIGRALVEGGQIAHEKVSMQAIRAWMDSHPDDARAVMEKDQSFVFFKEMPIGDPGLGSPGAENVALTPNASLAVDQRVHPLGAPFYVVASEPDPDPNGAERPLRRLYIAQDTGGAIRGPIRADLFFGYGRDSESVAGRMKASGRLYVLLPSALARRTVGQAS